MEASLTLRILLLGFAAAATAGFGVVVYAGNRERTANRFLAGFLFLIAGNQVSEMIRAQPAPPGGPVLWYKISSVFAALDPLFLYYFASIYPQRNSLNDRWKVAAVTGVSALMAGFALFRTPRGAGFTRGMAAQVAGVAWGSVTVVIYAVVLWSLVRRLRDEGADGPLPLLVAALAVATIPAVPRPVFGLSGILNLNRFATGLAGSFGVGVVELAAAPLLAAALWRYGSRGADRRSREALARSLWGALLLSLVIYVMRFSTFLEFLGVYTEGLREAFIFLRGVGASVRWIAFSALVSQAIVRHDMLGMSLKARRRTARTLVATGVVGAGALALAALQSTGANAPLDLGWSDMAFLGALAVLTQGFQKIIDQAAHRFYGVPPPGNERVAMEAYREAVEQAAGEGRDLEADARLQRLEEELELDPSTARTLREMGTASSGFDLAPGREIGGRYEVTREVGGSRMGSVYLARDTLLARDVVLKEVELERVDDKEDALAEARHAGSIQHPNILTVFDVLEGDDAFVLVTEHAGRGSLADKVQEEGPMDADEGVRLMEDVLAGLQAVHDEGLVHRDVKPSNVLLTDAKVPKVSDFGIARVRRDVDETFDEADVLAGTPAYMAPEQRRGKVATPRTDVYAMGRVVGRTLEDPLPPGVKEIQERALEEAPEERWPSAQAMREALRSWREGRGERAATEAEAQGQGEV